MTAQGYKEMMANAQKVVEKKQGTLQKYIKKADKLRKEIESKGWDIEAGKYQRAKTNEEYDCYWTFCDYEDALDGIRNTEKAIAEKQAIVEKWASKLADATEKEAVQEQFPEVLKSFQNEVISMWDRWDKRHREMLKADYEELGYKEFIKKHRHSGYEAMMQRDEEIHKANVKASEKLIMNLWSRVKDIVGEATDWSYLHVTQGNEWEGAVINGLVKGTNGIADVETIGAGGYNIQRFHYRTLVHKR